MYHLQVQTIKADTVFPPQWCHWHQLCLGLPPSQKDWFVCSTDYLIREKVVNAIHLWAKIIQSTVEIFHSDNHHHACYKMLIGTHPLASCHTRAWRCLPRSRSERTGTLLFFHSPRWASSWSVIRTQQKTVRTFVRSHPTPSQFYFWNDEFLNLIPQRMQSY